MTQEQLINIVLRWEDGKPISEFERCEANDMMEEQQCCGGYECGCQGSTHGQEILHYMKLNRPDAFARYEQNGNRL